MSACILGDNAPGSPPAGQTPLHLAVTAGSRETVRLLVDTKADINVQDSKSGKTALHYSIEKGDLPMAGYLLTEVCVCVCVCVCACACMRV